MYQNWSQSKFHLESLINDQHEMHIKNILKTTLKKYFIPSFFVSFKKFITEFDK